MALASNALCTVAMVKEYLDIESSDEDYDTPLENLINRASDIIETYIGKNIINVEHSEETHDGDGTCYLFLDNYPIISVSTITDDGDSVSTSDCDIYLDEGYIYYEDGFSSGHRVLVVTYTSGYGAAQVNIPEDFEQACIKLVSYWFRRDISDYSATYDEGHELAGPARGIPDSVKQLLNPYKARMFR